MTPLSVDAERMSVASRALLKVAVTVCAAVLVMKSVLLEPVSAEKAAAVTELVGAVLSNVKVRLVEEVLPAVSVSVTTTVWLPSVVGAV